MADSSIPNQLQQNQQPPSPKKRFFGGEKNVFEKEETGFLQEDFSQERESLENAVFSQEEKQEIDQNKQNHFEDEGEIKTQETAQNFNEPSWDEAAKREGYNVSEQPTEHIVEGEIAGFNPFEDEGEIFSAGGEEKKIEEESPSRMENTFHDDIFEKESSSEDMKSESQEFLERDVNGKDSTTHEIELPDEKLEEKTRLEEVMNFLNSPVSAFDPFEEGEEREEITNETSEEDSSEIKSTISESHEEEKESEERTDSSGQTKDILEIKKEETGNTTEDSHEEKEQEEIPLEEQKTMEESEETERNEEKEQELESKTEGQELSFEEKVKQQYAQKEQTPSEIAVSKSDEISDETLLEDPKEYAEILEDEGNEEEEEFEFITGEENELQEGEVLKEEGETTKGEFFNEKEEQKENLDENSDEEKKAFHEENSSEIIEPSEDENKPLEGEQVQEDSEQNPETILSEEEIQKDEKVANEEISGIQTESDTTLVESENTTPEVQEEHQDNDNEDEEEKTIFSQEEEEKEEEEEFEFITGKEDETVEGEALKEESEETDEEDLGKHEEPLVNENKEVEPDEQLSELVKKFLKLLHISRNILSLEQKEEKIAQCFEVLGSKNDTQTITYQASLIEDGGEHIDLFIKKLEIGKDETEEHLLQFTLEQKEQKNLLVLIDDYLLYDEKKDLIDDMNKKIQVSDKLGKFIFLFGEYLRELERIKKEEEEALAKKHQLRDVFRNF